MKKEHVTIIVEANIVKIARDFLTLFSMTVLGTDRICVISWFHITHKLCTAVALLSRLKEGTGSGCCSKSGTITAVSSSATLLFNMSFLKQLEEKKNALKKTEVSIKENAAPDEMIMTEAEDYRRMMKETYFEAYYDRIEEFTFKSVIVPMTLEETNSLMEAHTQLMESADKNVDLSGLALKVDKGISLIRQRTGKNCKVFVRFSSQSPKDAIFLLESFPNVIQEKLLSFETSKEELHCKLHALYMASVEVLAVSLGEDAVELMRRSARIQGDLEDSLKSRQPMNLIIREFVTFPVKSELRGFVYQGVFTALTQYNKLAYFPENIESKADIEEKVTSFVKVFIKAMESVLDSFVMDIVIDEAGKVWVVEVNLFGEVADPCLFHWDTDKAILMGKEPFQFRIVEATPSLSLVKSRVDPKVLAVLGIK